MTVYVLAMLEFRDLERYRRYQERFAAVFRESGGSLLVADEQPRTLEGEHSIDKVVMMSFPGEEEALAWLGSDAYQKIATDRKAGAKTLSLMLNGLPVRG